MDQNKIAVDIFNKRARGYEEKYMDVSAYHDTFDLFCDRLPANAHVLDVACGPGNITRYLLGKQPDLRILGIDLAPNMIDLALANNPTAAFQVMDCREIGGISTKYDGIMCGFCLPYLSPLEAVQLITDAKGILHPGGTLYISTMEEDEHNKSGVRSSSYGDEMYLYYHSADYLLSALKENGLEIVDLRRIAIGNMTEGNDMVILGGVA